MHVFACIIITIYFFWTSFCSLFCELSRPLDEVCKYIYKKIINFDTENHDLAIELIWKSCDYHNVYFGGKTRRL